MSNPHNIPFMVTEIVKRSFILLTCLMSSSILTAQHISEEQALMKAQTFLNGKISSDNKARTRSSKGLQQLKNAAKDDAFYIFNAEDDGGFVIVSGDERTDAILGYSMEGNIDLDHMPENMRAWLAGYEEQLKVLSSSVSYSAEDTSVHPAIEPLVTAKWHQGSPYNLQCPEYNGSRCITGCGATAMAQVMYYHKWPKDYTSEIPGYNIDYMSLESLPSVKFDWGNMRDGYYDSMWSTPATDEENNAVAQLMRYCGQSVKMLYGLQMSGIVNVALIQNALIAYFGYDTHAMTLRRNDYTIKEWDNLIYHELQAGRPIIYSGSPMTNSAGHLFVCDGYDGHGSYHINWGWGGDNDGYYKLSILKDDNFNYNSSQTVVVGIQPPTNDASIINAPLEAVVLSYDAYNYDYFDFNLRYYNLGFDRVCDLGFCIENEDGTPVGDVVAVWKNVEIKRGEFFNDGNDAYVFLKDYFPSLPLGRYFLYPVWRDSHESKFHKYREGITNYLDFTITSTTSSYGNLVTVIEHGNFNDNIECTITPSGYLIANNLPAVFYVTFKNHGDEYDGKVYLSVSKTDVEDLNQLGYVGGDWLELEKDGESTISLQHIFKEEGTYYVWVRLGKTNGMPGKEVGKTTVTISRPVSLSPQILYMGETDWSTTSIPVSVGNYGSEAYDREIAVYISDSQYDTADYTEGKLYKSEKLHVEPGEQITTNITIDPLDIDRFNRISLMYYINPNNDTLYPFTSEILRPWQIFEKVFYVDNIRYWIIDTKNNYVSAHGHPDYTQFRTNTLVYPSEVTNPADGIVYKVKGIGGQNLMSKDVGHVIISEGITTIQRGSLCSEAIETVALPASLREIEASSIGGPQLKSIYSKSPEPPIIVDTNGKSIFLIQGDKNDAKKYTPTLYVPIGSKAVYAKEWPKFTNIVEMDFDNPGTHPVVAPVDGDANSDRKVDVADIVKLVNDHADKSDIETVVNIIMKKK